MSAETLAAAATVRPRWAGLDLKAALAVALPALLAFCVVLFAPQVLGDGDSWWHIAAGQWMLDHRQVVRTDPFSFTFAGKPWHAQEWLAEVLMAVAYGAAGWSGVLILAGAFAAVAVGALAWGFRQRLDPLPALAALVLAAGCLSPSLLVRPHLMMLPLLAVWTLALLDARSKARAPSPWWALLIVLWANLHGSFIFGLALIGPFALEALLESRDRLTALRQWAVFGLLSLAAAFVTPFGVEGVLFPLWMSNLSSLHNIVEWRPPDFSQPQPVEIALLAGLGALLWKGARVPPLRLLVLLGLVWMTLGHQRHQVLLAIVGGLIVAEALGRRPEPGAARTGLQAALALSLALTFAAAGLRLAYPLERRDDAVSPVSALAHVSPALRSKPVLNDYDLGGYLIFQGVKPMIDGRTDMYGDAFNARFDAAVSDRAALEKALQDFGIGWTLLSPRSRAAALMDAEPGWRRLYADRFAVVHVRQ